MPNTLHGAPASTANTCQRLLPHRARMGFMPGTQGQREEPRTPSYRKALSCKLRGNQKQETSPYRTALSSIGRSPPARASGRPGLGKRREAVSTDRGRVLHRKSNQFTRENERGSLQDEIKTKPTVFLHSSNEQFKKEMKKKTYSPDENTKTPLSLSSEPRALRASHQEQWTASRPPDRARPSSGVHCPAAQVSEAPRGHLPSEVPPSNLRLLLGHSQVA